MRSGKLYRPRLSESEFFRLHKIREQEEGIYRLLVISDPHGVLLCKKSFCCFLEILKHNPFNEVLINGDLGDFPYLSSHSHRLWEDGVLRNYTEINEIEFIKKNILAPIKEVAPLARKVIKPGNHDERVTKPRSLTKEQLERLSRLHVQYNTLSYAEMLDLKGMGFAWDDRVVTNYFNVFDATHGLSLAKTASEKNIYEYMSSGTTGHTHRANPKYITNAKGQYGWFESGCMRIREQVEYFPTGKIADWQNALIPVTFDLRGEKPVFHARPHLIIGGECEYNGVIYDGKSIGL
jgi:hypothetical protein